MSAKELLGEEPMSIKMALVVMLFAMCGNAQNPTVAIANAREVFDAMANLALSGELN